MCITKKLHCNHIVFSVTIGGNFSRFSIKCTAGVHMHAKKPDSKITNTCTEDITV